MIFRYIEKLRRKPERTKKLIAFSWSLFFCGIIFLVWLTAVYPNIIQDKEIKDKIASVEPSPFSGFLNNISAGFSGIKEQFNGVKEKISEFSQNTVFVNATSTATTTDYVIPTPEEKVYGPIPITESATNTPKIGE